MAYSLEQKMMLEAMGIRLYVPVAGLNAQALEPAKNHGDFWQTRLGANIQRFAKGHDLSALPVASAQQGIVAKRMLWLQVRALLKSA